MSQQQQHLTHPFEERQRLAVLVKEKLSASPLTEDELAQAFDRIDTSTEENLKHLSYLDAKHIMVTLGLHGSIGPISSVTPKADTDRNDTTGVPDTLDNGPRTGHE